MPNGESGYSSLPRTPEFDSGANRRIAPTKSPSEPSILRSNNTPSNRSIPSRQRKMYNSPSTTTPHRPSPLSNMSLPPLEPEVDLDFDINNTDFNFTTIDPALLIPNTVRNWPATSDPLDNIPGPRSSFNGCPRQSGSETRYRGVAPTTPTVHHSSSALQVHTAMRSTVTTREIIDPSLLPAPLSLSTSRSHPSCVPRSALRRPQRLSGVNTTRNNSQAPFSMASTQRHATVIPSPLDIHTPLPSLSPLLATTSITGTTLMATSRPLPKLPSTPLIQHHHLQQQQSLPPSSLSQSLHTTAQQPAVKPPAAMTTTTTALTLPKSTTATHITTTSNNNNNSNSNHNLVCNLCTAPFQPTATTIRPDNQGRAYCAACIYSVSEEVVTSQKAANVNVNVNADADADACQ